MKGEAKCEPCFTPSYPSPSMQTLQAGSPVALVYIDRNEINEWMVKDTQNSWFWLSYDCDVYVEVTFLHASTQH